MAAVDGEPIVRVIRSRSMSASAAGIQQHRERFGHGRRHGSREYQEERPNKGREPAVKGSRCGRGGRGLIRGDQAGQQQANRQQWAQFGRSTRGASGGRKGHKPKIVRKFSRTSRGMPSNADASKYQKGPGYERYNSYEMSHPKWSHELNEIEQYPRPANLPAPPHRKPWHVLWAVRGYDSSLEAKPVCNGNTRGAGARRRWAAVGEPIGMISGGIDGSRRSAAAGRRLMRVGIPILSQRVLTCIKNPPSPRTKMAGYIAEHSGGVLARRTARVVAVYYNSHGYGHVFESQMLLRVCGSASARVPGCTCGHVWRGFAEVGLGASAGFSRQSCAQLRQASCEAASHHLAPPRSRCAEAPQRISPKGPLMYLLCQLWPKQDSGQPSNSLAGGHIPGDIHSLGSNSANHGSWTRWRQPNTMEPMADLTTAWLGEKGAASLWFVMLGRPRQGLPSLRFRDRRNAVNVATTRDSGQLEVKLVADLSRVESSQMPDFTRLASQTESTSNRLLPKSDRGVEVPVQLIAVRNDLKPFLTLETTYFDPRRRYSWQATHLGNCATDALVAKVDHLK
ncbi:hypothetical protein DFH08DRAFT_814988 [Mycena albidolilacea]|uniref:Uncharacterized protein n=1 Tax=Mycena albidolilacea TaxID=1033008 RepID=A0AAD6ZNH2_9AGAR|nr:hypothetical protein DFH08DRAFT_814988 [Mycena albidolilacea]